MKSKYDAVILPNWKLIQAWIRDGKTEEYCYKRLGISKNTWNNYKNDHRDFHDILQKTKEFIDFTEVVPSLLKRTMGYDAPESKQIYERDPSTGEMVLVREEKTVRHIPPDPRSIELWLRLRQTATWNEKYVEAEVTDGPGVVLIPERHEEGGE